MIYKIKRRFSVDILSLISVGRDPYICKYVYKIIKKICVVNAKMT